MPSFLYHFVAVCRLLSFLCICKNLTFLSTNLFFLFSFFFLTHFKLSFLLHRGNGAFKFKLEAFFLPVFFHTLSGLFSLCKITISSVFVTYFLFALCLFFIHHHHCCFLFRSSYDVCFPDPRMLPLSRSCFSALRACLRVSVCALKILAFIISSRHQLFYVCWG